MFDEMDVSLLDEPVVVVEYDASWPERFERERQRVADALSGLAVEIEHIGSTSVPGLAAKPIVDLLVGIRPGAPRARVVAALVALGYQDVGLYLRRRGSEGYNVNLAEHGSRSGSASLASATTCGHTRTRLGPTAN
jgi:GrpB-like predicted nucleotidyltransferase (UPF0157 family)